MAEFVGRLGWTLRHWDGVALVRALYWRFARFHPYEICGDCGRPVGRCTASWWAAPDELWNEVTNDPHLVLCPPCFTSRAAAAGIPVRYAAVEDA